MRASRIEIEGYRRLARTATNIDAPLTAFVGFNEAGKTSLLRALSWFTSGGAIDPIDFNRSRPPADSASPVVKVFFELDREDKAALTEIPMDNAPSSLVLYKMVDGRRIREFVPKPSRPGKPFADALARLEKAETNLARQLVDAAHDEHEDPNDWTSELRQSLAKPNDDWSDKTIRAVESLSRWMSEIPSGRKQPRDAKLAAHLEVVRSLIEYEHPEQAAWDVLSYREPSFVFFAEEDRVLETSYEIHPDQRTTVHPAVRRLLALAAIDLDAMWSHVETGDSTKRETLLERGNDRLRLLFDQAWNQSKIAVRFNVNGTRLEVLIKELHGQGDVTNISERSDGLKTFVALVAFLETGEHNVPPILLIDEAETHLHYDAQADLVSVLLKSVDTTQVIYTTHSPGCLPGDLGTGIRVVTRDPGHADASIIKNNFWEGEGPGFSPLLFAMGAGAAAFSMCRNAVLAEGASDMVLLPTLIRQATNVDDLDYQVAPGLANAHGSGMRVEEVAAKVVYLTDGDDGGREHENALAAVGVDRRRMFRLPNGFAVEDLIHRDDYVDVLNEFLDRMGQTVKFTITDVPTETPIAKAVTDWAKAKKVRIPSKVEMAYALISKSDRRLKPEGKRALVGLHAKFVTAFEAS